MCDFNFQKYFGFVAYFWMQNQVVKLWFLKVKLCGLTLNLKWIWDKRPCLIKPCNGYRWKARSITRYYIEPWQPSPIRWKSNDGQRNFICFYFNTLKLNAHFKTKYLNDTTSKSKAFREMFSLYWKHDILFSSTQKKEMP